MNLMPFCIIPLLLLLLLAAKFTLANGTNTGNDEKVPEVTHGHKAPEVPGVKDFGVSNHHKKLSEVPNGIEVSEVPNGIEVSGLPNGEEVCNYKKEMIIETLIVTQADGQEKEFQIQQSKFFIAKGSSGHIFHAHYLDAKGKPPCVALKKVIVPGENMDNEIGIMQEFAKLVPEHSRHLVKLFDQGRIFFKKAYTMELGEKSLEEYFKNNAADLTKEKIMEIVEEIALAMQDFHRVAMHLDVKPANMMYFKEPNGEEVLKPIDFGTSKRLKRTGRRTLSTVFDEGPENRANFWLEVNEKVGTERYASPEIEHANGINKEECAEHANPVHAVESAAESVTVPRLTPKSDIWSIGLMIYEAILSSSHTDLAIFYDFAGKTITDEIIEMDQIIHALNWLYRYDKQTWISKRKDAIKQEIEEHNDKDHWKNGGKNQVKLSDDKIEEKSVKEYPAYVYLVLKVRLEHPFLYELINSCLEFKPVHRPSVIGILQYLFLDGNCTMESIKEDSTPILLDTETVKKIAKYFPPKWHSAMLSREAQQKQQQQLHLPKEEIKRIEKFYKRINRRENFNLRTECIHANAKGKGDRGSPIAKHKANGKGNATDGHQSSGWCDTSKSEMPEYKVAKQFRRTNQLSTKSEAIRQLAAELEAGNISAHVTP